MERGDFRLDLPKIGWLVEGHQDSGEITIALHANAANRPRVKEYTAARRTLDAHAAANPDFRSSEGHLLYARAVEAEGDTDAALHEYEALVQGFPARRAACATPCC